MKTKLKHIKTVLLLVGLVLFMILTPLVSDTYAMTVVNSGLIYFLATLGISLLLGMGGQMSLAAISFMGLGAFFSGVLSKNLGWTPAVTILLSIIGVSVIAFLLGLVLFRLSGAYFTFATIGLVQIFSCIFTNFKPLSGAMDGMSGIPPLQLFGMTFDTLTEWFYLLCACGVLIAAIVERIRRTKLGRSLASVRDDEVAAQTLGVNVYMTKVIAMTIASAFAAFAGALLAHHNGAASYSLFTFTTGTRFIIMVMLGGVSSTIGTFVGTMLITVLPEYMRFLQEYLNIIYGAIVVLLMVFMPMGLAGLANHLWKKLTDRLIRHETMRRTVSPEKRQSV